MKKNNHIILSTVLTIVVSLVPMLIFKSKLPAEVPIHWDTNGNVNGSLSQVAFVYVTPLIMGLINLTACYKNSSKFSKNLKLYYIVPLVCFLITALMLYLALK